MRAKLSSRGDLLSLFFFIGFTTLVALSRNILPALGIEVTRLGHGLLVQVVGWFVFLVVYLLFTKQKLSDVLLLKAPSFKHILLAVVITIAFFPITSAFMSLMQFLWNLAFPDIDATAATLAANIAAVPLWHRMIFHLAVPSVGEELWYRGVFHNAYRRQGLSVGKVAIITGLFFGIGHGISSIPYMILICLVWTYLLYYTRSIWIPILAHTLNNAIAHLMIFIFEGDANAYSPYISAQMSAQQGITGNFEIDLIIFWGFISLFMIPIVILCFRKLKKDHFAEVGERTDADIIGEVDTSQAKGKVFTWAFWLTIAILLGYILLDYFVF